MSEHDPWHISFGTHKRGPMPLSEVIRGIRLGKVTPENEVYTLALGRWTPITQVPELSPYLKPQSDAAKAPPAPTHRRHTALDYAIQGDDIQHIELVLDPGEQCYSEAAALVYMDAGIQITDAASMTGSDFWASISAAFSYGSVGEHINLSVYQNVMRSPKRIALTASIPGRVLALEVSSSGAPIYGSPQAFLAASMGVTMTPMDRSRGWFSTLERYQHFRGDGTLFLQSSGNLIERRLAAGEVIHISAESLLAVSGDLNLVQVEQNTSLWMPHRPPLATLTGPLHVWLHTQPLSRQVREIQRLYPPLPST